MNNFPCRGPQEPLPTREPLATVILASLVSLHIPSPRPPHLKRPPHVERPPPRHQMAWHSLRGGKHTPENHIAKSYGPNTHTACRIHWATLPSKKKNKRNPTKAERVLANRARKARAEDRKEARRKADAELARGDALLVLGLKQPRLVALRSPLA